MNIKAYGKITNRFHLAIYSHNKLVGTQYDDPMYNVRELKNKHNTFSALEQ